MVLPKVDSMKCPYCSSLEDKVVDSRDAEDFSAVRRRRECLKCKKRFTTYERAELAELWVVKKDGTRQRFERHKIENGVLKACEKRPITREQIQSIVDKVEMEIRHGDSIEIPSKKIGEIVMKHLRTLDKVAYVRFASVYRSFADIGSFERALKKLKKS
jgi:transcriptional repressor NrdR